MQPSHAWNACQRMPSKTSIPVFILIMIGTRSTNGIMVMYTPTKKNAVQMAWRITTRSSPCSRTTSIGGGRSALCLDAGSPLLRAMLRAASEKEQKAIIKGLHILPYGVPLVIPCLNFEQVAHHLFLSKAIAYKF
jgi:hypothetical protein